MYDEKGFPVYQYGDRVSDLDGERQGTVIGIGEWDGWIGCYRYLVAQSGGPTHWRNGANLVMWEPTRAGA